MPGTPTVCDDFAQVKAFDDRTLAEDALRFRNRAKNMIK
jgi:hypothetical protein